MCDQREHVSGVRAPFRLCFPQLGRKAKGVPDRQDAAQRRVTAERGRPVCALDMEMTNFDLSGDSKLDCGNLGGLISRNGGDSSKVSVSVTQRTGPMEGDNLYRLRDRKFLLEDKKRLCALALATAVLGIVLMIIHAETCTFIDKTVGVEVNCASAGCSSHKGDILCDVPRALTADLITSCVHFYMHIKYYQH